MNYPDKEVPNPLAKLHRAFHIDVPAEQQERFLKMTPGQRLRWLDEARRFTLLVHGLLRKRHAS
jgi:hypothetical protein